jgi:segregation and condensation protein A
LSEPNTGGKPGAAAVSLAAFRAELEVFSGPLDLLLHLIRQEEVDIFEVQVSRVTERYLAALKTMELFDVNVAAEFLVVAAALMEIKSRTLLPPGEADEEEEQDDPGVELVRRLLQYKEVKEAAGDLGERALGQTTRFARPAAEAGSADARPGDAYLEDLAVWDLMAAFAEVVEQTQLRRPEHVVRGSVPVAVYVEEVLRRLRAWGGEGSFMDFFRSERTRERVIGIFLALLELVRRETVEVEQPTGEASSIRVRLRRGAGGAPDV